MHLRAVLTVTAFLACGLTVAPAAQASTAQALATATATELSHCLHKWQPTVHTLAGHAKVKKLCRYYAPRIADAKLNLAATIKITRGDTAYAYARLVAARNNCGSDQTCLANVDSNEGARYRSAVSFGQGAVRTATRVLAALTVPLRQRMRAIN